MQLFGRFVINRPVAAWALWLLLCVPAVLGACGIQLTEFIQDRWVSKSESQELIDTALTFGEEKTMDSASLDHTVSTVSKTRVSDDGFQWYMPFETFTEDLKSVQRDLFDFGKGFPFSQAGKDKNTAATATSEEAKTAAVVLGMTVD